LYFGLAGYSILLIYAFGILIDGGNRKLTSIFAFFLFFYIFYGLFNNWSEIETSFKEGQVRENILKTIKNSHPVLPKKVIIYSDSDSPLYGLADQYKILPFQSGFGQTVLVWYYNGDNINREFYKDRFLWNITSEGYKEISGQGFGYFRNFDTLKSVVKQYNIPLDSVIAYSWKKDTGEFKEESMLIRDKLKE